MTKRLYIMSFLLTIVIAAGFVACGDDDDDSGNDDNGEQDPRATLTLLYPVPASLPLFPGVPIAQELGYYEEENLEVNIQGGDGGSQVVQQLLAGNTDLGVVPTGNVTEAVAQGFTNLRSLYAIFYGSIFALVVPADSDIQQAEDLEGRALGVTDLAGGELAIVRGILNSAGLQESDVEILPLGSATATVVRSLETGQVDAFASSLQDIAAMEAQGVELRTIVPEELAELPANGFVATQEYLDGNEEVVERFLRATAKGFQFARANPDAAVEIIEGAYPEFFAEPAGEFILRNYITLTEAPAGTVPGSQSPETWQAFFEFIAAEAPDEDLTQIVPGGYAERADDYDHAEIEAQAENY